MSAISDFLRRPLRSTLTGLAFMLAGLAPAGAAVCSGNDLIAALSDDARQALYSAAEQVAYPSGLFWQATRGKERITLLGTYHFADPRHDKTLDAFRGQIEAAAELLVEAGPDEQEHLKNALLTQPELIMDAEGATLPERLSPEDWNTLAAALSERGIPAIVGSRMRPWYVSLMMGVSPCMIEVMRREGSTGGLDEMLIVAAQEADVPVRALEPWDTLFKLFQDMTPEEEIEMILAGLPAAEAADDYAQTLTNAYFDQQVRLIWEFTRADAYEKSGMTPERVDEQLELAERELMDKRNESWIAPIETASAAAGGKGIVVAFGALHLPGERGVLRLLEGRGWKIAPLPAPDWGR